MKRSHIEKYIRNKRYAYQNYDFSRLKTLKRNFLRSRDERRINELERRVLGFAEVNIQSQRY